MSSSGVIVVVVVVGVIVVIGFIVVVRSYCRRRQELQLGSVFCPFVVVVFELFGVFPFVRESIVHADQLRWLHASYMAANVRKWCLLT